MAPKGRLSKRKAARGTPVLTAGSDTTSASKSSKSKRVKKPAVSLKVETPDAKPLHGTRRSPRITQKVKSSLTRIDLLKENVKRGQKKKVNRVKKERMEEEEEEEEEDEEEEWEKEWEKEEEEEEEEEMMVDIKPLKEEPDSELSDGEEETPGLSEYEKRRLENISKNADFFASLDIFKAKENFLALTPQAQKPKRQTRGLKSQRRESAPVERRPRSLRLQNKNPDGAALPENFREPTYTPYVSDVRSRERLPSDPVKMDATNVKKEEKTDAGTDFVEGLAALARGEKTTVKADDKDLNKFTSKLQKMKMKPRYMAKVVPDRIFSVAVHPSVEKTIVVAGDKWGKIGLWDVNSTEGDDGVFLFAPHTRPVNCLRFSPSDPNKLYSVSYDGTVRCGDFAKAVFDEIYVADEDEVIWTNFFDFMSADGSSILVTQNDRTGNVVVVDTRSRKGGENVYNVHSRNAKTVSVHPTMPHYFVTASTDRTAALWDIRSMKSKGTNKPIAEMPHFKSVSSAFFSPITGSKILTTSLDDKISIFDTESAKEGKLTGVKRTLWQSHNNWTGRWLTVFRAAWHPRREDAYVVGSMCQPRRIEVFSSKGKPIHQFFDDYLGSVCSINEFHPTRDLLVGGNSSGKLHVLMA